MDDFDQMLATGVTVSQGNLVQHDKDVMNKQPAFATFKVRGGAVSPRKNAAWSSPSVLKLHRSHFMNITRAVGLLSLSLMVATLAACGGGAGSSSTTGTATGTATGQLSGYAYLHR